jgi:hypothetical protein
VNLTSEPAFAFLLIPPDRYRYHQHVPLARFVNQLIVLYYCVTRSSALCRHHCYCKAMNGIGAFREHALMKPSTARGRYGEQEMVKDDVEARVGVGGR